MIPSIFQHRQPLTDSFERLHEAIGLVESIPPAEALSEEDRVRFDKRSQDALALFDLRSKRAKDARGEEQVHQVQLLIIQLLPVSMLLAWLKVQWQSFEADIGNDGIDELVEEFREVIAKPAGTEGREADIRSFALYLLETRRQMVRERTKRSQQQSFLLSKLFGGWLKISIPLLLFLGVFGLAKSLADAWIFSSKDDLAKSSPYISLANEVGPILIKESRTKFAHDDQNAGGEEGSRQLPRETATYQIMMAAAIIVFSGLAGASGAFASAFLRIQKAVPTAAFSKDVAMLREAGNYIHYSPFIGCIFAFILSAMFAGQLIGGGLFPDVAHRDGWYFSFWSSTELPKWLVWGFFAGFSERFVPDLLSKVVSRSEAQIEETLIANQPARNKAPLDKEM